MSTHEDDKDLTRREFAAVGGAALLAALLPLACGESTSQLPIGPNKVNANAELLRDLKEDLGNGATRTTQVIAWKSIPPLGVATTQTVISTRTPTATGEIIEYEMQFDPYLPIAIGTHNTKRIRARYEFTHGPIRGDMREDTLTVSGDVDGQLSPKATKKVLRPLQASGLAALSTKDQLARGLELLNKHGKIPKGGPGTLRVIGDDQSQM